MYGLHKDSYTGFRKVEKFKIHELTNDASFAAHVFPSPRAHNQVYQFAQQEHAIGFACMILSGAFG